MRVVFDVCTSIIWDLAVSSNNKSQIINPIFCFFTQNQGAGLTAGFARTIGIAVDRRRRNKSVEGQQENIQRLKEYRSKLILFPVHANRKLRKGEATEEERKTATQHTGPVLPISKAVPEIEFRQITDEEKKFNAFHTLRRVSINNDYLLRCNFIPWELTFVFFCVFRLVLMLVWLESVQRKPEKPPKMLKTLKPRSKLFLILTQIVYT